MRPTLTIAIPTFDHCVFLKKLLDSISDQLRHREEVELIVSDNASPDATEQVVRLEQARGTPLRYIRNAVNVGPDANFLQCYEAARGKYLWLIGDDDLLCPGAVSLVLEHLARAEYDLVYVSPTVFREDAPRWPRTARRVPVREFTDAVQYVQRVHIFTTFISGNIINRDRVDAIGHEPFSRLVDTNLLQLGWIFTALRGHRRSLFFGEGLLLTRPSFRGGYGLCRVFGITLLRITEEWLAMPGLNRIIINAALQRLLPAALWGRRRASHAAYLREAPHAMLVEAYRGHARYWLFDYPLIGWPTVPAYAWYFISRIINRIDRACGFPLLRL